jgi:hypothetical protein
VEETGGPGENHWPVASQWQTLSHNVVHLALIEIQTHGAGSCYMVSPGTPVSSTQKLTVINKGTTVESVMKQK